jgi:exodeoxyribonuclease VII small subunit
MAAQKPTQQPATPLAPTQLPLIDWHYETAVANVEAIIADIETGQLDLADVFEQYQTAVEQLRRCEAFLQERQQQMELLIEELGQDPEG